MVVSPLSGADAGKAGLAQANLASISLSMSLAVMEGSFASVSAAESLFGDLWVARPASPKARQAVVAALDGLVTASTATAADAGAGVSKAVQIVMDDTQFSRARVAGITAATGSSTGVGAGSWRWRQTISSTIEADAVWVLRLQPPSPSSAAAGSGAGAVMYAVALPEWFLDGSDAASVKAAAVSVRPPLIGPIGAGLAAPTVALAAIQREAGASVSSSVCGTVVVSAQQEDGPASFSDPGGAPGLLRRDSLRQSLQRSSRGRDTSDLAAPSRPAPGEETLPEHGAAPAALDGNLHATVLHHHHTRYCDRTLRVCTAEGRLRQGNGLVLDASRVPELAEARALHTEPAMRDAGWTIDWFASIKPASGTPGTDEDASGAAAAGPTGEEEEAEVLVVDDERFTRITQPVPPTIPLPPPTAASTATEDLPFEWLAFLEGCGVPTTMPRLSPAAVLAARAALDAGGSAAADVMPTFSSAGACADDVGLFIECGSDPWHLALSAELVGRSLVCRVSRKASAEAATDGKSWVSPVWGPVEPGPPRCREVWVEGEAVAGGVLTANAWYWGGEPGSCAFHWVRVSSEGDRKTFDPRSAELSDPLDAAAITAALSGAAASESGLPTDGRIMPVTAEDVGCKFKVTAEPARNDGMVAERTSSRPSKAVVAAAE